MLWITCGQVTFSTIAHVCATFFYADASFVVGEEEIRITKLSTRRRPLGSRRLRRRRGHAKRKNPISGPGCGRGSSPTTCSGYVPRKETDVEDPKRGSLAAGAPGQATSEIRLPRTPVNTSTGRQATLRQGLDAVAGSDAAAREYVGSQPAPVYEAAQHPRTC
jgi:hypothetical protein